MTYDELRGCFTRHESESYRFGRILDADRRSSRPDLAAMLLLAERFPSEYNMICHSEHDKIWFKAKLSQGDGCPLTEADVIYLRRCGVFMDGDDLCMFT